MNSDDTDDDVFDIPSWSRRRNEIEQRNGNLKEGAMSYLHEIRHHVLDEYNLQLFGFLGDMIQEFNDDSEILLLILSLRPHMGWPLTHLASPRLRDNAEFMKKMAKADGANLPFASYRLLDNREFMTEMVKEDDANCRMASISLRRDKAFMKQIIRMNGRGLCYADNILRDDEELVSLAISKKGTALEYASPGLQDNKRIALEAVKNDGLALEFVSPRLRNDFETVLAAVRSNSVAEGFASDCLRQNINIVVNSELRGLDLPTTDILLNHQESPTTSFPSLFQRANRFPLITYYCLKNRPDLIPSNSAVVPISNTKRKRKRV